MPTALRGHGSASMLTQRRGHGTHSRSAPLEDSGRGGTVPGTLTRTRSDARMNPSSRIRANHGDPSSTYSPAHELAKLGESISGGRTRVCARADCRRKSDLLVTVATESSADRARSAAAQRVHAAGAGA